MSVRLSQHGLTAADPLLQVCCCGPGGQEISIDCCSSDVRRANAGSGTLSAYVVAEHWLVCVVVTVEEDGELASPSAAALRPALRQSDHDPGTAAGAGAGAPPAASRKAHSRVLTWDRDQVN